MRIYKIFIALICTVVISISNSILTTNMNKKQNDRQTSAKSHRHEVQQVKVNLSWDEVKNINTIGRKITINIYSELNDGTRSLDNVRYIIKFTKDNAAPAKEDITLIRDSREVQGINGIYSIAEEKMQDRDKNYSFIMIFNNPGKYEIEAYAES